MDDFNSKIINFVTKNKFFDIGVGMVTQVHEHEIEIDYKLQCCDYSSKYQAFVYRMIASLTGFNNLNLKAAANHCELQSEKFYINLRLIDTEKMFKFFNRCYADFHTLSDAEKEVIFVLISHIEQESITRNLLERRDVAIGVHHSEQSSVKCSEIVLD